MKKYYNFAGIDVEISVPDQWMYEKEGMMEEFRVERVENPHRYQFEIVSELLPPIGEKVVEYPDYCVYVSGTKQIRYLKSANAGWECAQMRMLHEGREHLIQVKSTEHIDRINAKIVKNAMNFEHLLTEVQGVILHASYIEYNNNAILFTAASGVGKSTQANLWNQYRSAGIINGDRAVMKLENGMVYAAGIPFAGSSTFCENKTMPLQAIVCLEQNKENSIEQLRGMQAFRKVWEGCTVNNWNPVNVSNAVDVVNKIISCVPVYYLKCTPDEKAVVTLEEVLMGEMKDEKK